LQCPVCGAENTNDAKKCRMCGYPFPKVFHGDIRDEKLSQELRDSERFKRELDRNLNLFLMKLQNLHPGHSYPEEIETTLSKALIVLDIPLRIKSCEKMHISEKERELLLLARKRMEEADMHFKHLLQTAETYVRMGNALFSIEEYDAAMQYYEKAILKQPKLAVAHFNKANMLFCLKKYKESLKCLDKVMNIDPDFEDVVSFRALVSQLALTEEN